MTLPTLELEPGRKERAVSTISEMLGQYNQQKQSEKIAALLGIQKEKRSDFASLPPEWQKTYATMFQKEQAGQAKRRASAEKIPKGAASYLKEFYPSLYDRPEAKRSIGQRARDIALESDIPETEAYEQAIKEFRTPKKAADLEAGEVPGEEPRTTRDFLADLFTKAKEAPAPEHPMTTLEKERPGGTLASLGLGAVSPIEEIARFQSKPAMEFVKSLGFTYPEGAERGPLVTEKLREKLQAPLSEKGKKAAGGAELIGAFLPVERLVSGLKLIGKSAGFLKNAEKIAAREGISAAEAAQKIAKEAESVGINLEKAAAGDKQEAGKLFNLSNRISREAPKTATELRVARAEPKAKMFPKEERIATRESQLKAFPKYEAEIAKDAAERAARAEAKIPKTVKGMDAKKIRVHTAEKNLPVAEQGYRNALARTRALEDEVVKLKGADKQRAEGLLEAAKNEQRDAEFFLKQTRQNIVGGEARAGLGEMRQSAQKKMLDISDKIAAGEEIKLAKMDYNPQMVQEANALSKKKPIPAVKKDDFYQQVHKEYGDQYRTQLNRIEKEIKDSPKTMGQAEKIRNLQKEKEVLNKLIDQTEAERAIHQHKLSLRETAERHRAKERLGKLQPREAEPKVQKVAHEKFEEAFKNPEGKTAEDLSQKAGAKKEDFKEAKSEFKDAWSKVKEETEKVKTKSAKEPKEKKVPPAGTDLRKELRRTLLNIQKKRFFHIFMRTPVGREILYSLAVSTANDAFNLKINPYLSAIAGRRTAMYPVRAVFNQIYHWIGPKKQIVKQQYKRAIEKNQDQKVADIERKHPKWAKEAIENLY